MNVWIRSITLLLKFRPGCWNIYFQVENCLKTRRPVTPCSYTYVVKKKNYAIRRENYASDPAPKYYGVQSAGSILSLSKPLLSYHALGLAQWTKQPPPKKKTTFPPNNRNVCRYCKAAQIAPTDQDLDAHPHPMRVNHTETPPESNGRASLAALTHPGFLAILGLDPSRIWGRPESRLSRPKAGWR